MKLLFLQTSSILENYGGIEYYIHDFITLSQKIWGSHNIHTLIPLRENSESALTYPHTFIAFTKKGILSKIENRLSLNYLKTALKKIQQLKPDFLINTHVSLGAMTYLLSKISNIPYITFVYGIDGWENLFPQDEWALKHSKKVITISECSKNQLKKKGIMQVSIVHPIAPHDFLNSTIKEKKEGPFTLLTVSRLDKNERYKGHDDVLSAIKKINLNLRYIIQGSGSDLERLKNKVKELKLEDKVEFKNPVKDRSQLIESYQNADVFIMPSYFGKINGKWKGEGFGITYLEAQTQGLPVIAYQCGGVTDIIEDGTNGFLVTPYSIDELSQKITILANQPELKSQMGKKSIEFSHKRFTPSIIENDIKNVLETLKTAS